MRVLTGEGELLMLGAIDFVGLATGGRYFEATITEAAMEADVLRGAVADGLRGQVATDVLDLAARAETLRIRHAALTGPPGTVLERYGDQIRVRQPSPARPTPPLLHSGRTPGPIGVRTVGPRGPGHQPQGEPMDTTIDRLAELTVRIGDGNDNGFARYLPDLAGHVCTLTRYDGGSTVVKVVDFGRDDSGFETISYRTFDEASGEAVGNVLTVSIGDIESIEIA